MNFIRNTRKTLVEKYKNININFLNFYSKIKIRK